MNCMLSFSETYFFVSFHFLNLNPLTFDWLLLFLIDRILLVSWFILTWYLSPASRACFLFVLYFLFLHRASFLNQKHNNKINKQNEVKEISWIRESIGGNPMIIFHYFDFQIQNVWFVYSNWAFRNLLFKFLCNCLSVRLVIWKSNKTPSRIVS